MPRGGNRQKVEARADGARPPPPPPGLSTLEADLWARLADAVAALGTYQPTDEEGFRALVRVAARARSLPLDAPPGPAGNAEQRLAVALASFGLTPQSRASLKVAPRRAAEPHPLDEFAT